ncbi:hypothetical protein MJO28_000951 [Puccinia striiformis f. sp. tritici]|uniref:Uncharacterized protein n=1 Tax=Puccinia striiformis f. sp. tritici TaxID=168172 RepID=A0ACC0EZF4_9BASI|nr:hypothetical protein MJO28_000951 [Puccinia striiformis f. sp. tritici]
MDSHIINGSQAKKIKKEVDVADIKKCYTLILDEKRSDDGNFSVYDPNHNNRSSSRNPIPTPAPVPSESAIVPPPATTGVYPFVVDHQLPAAGEVVKSDQLTPGVATTNAMDTT